MVYNNNTNEYFDINNFKETTSYRDLYPEFYANSGAPRGIQRATSEDMIKRFDVMEEFRLNGVDSPYDPEQERAAKSGTILSGPDPGPVSTYLRQKSWPEPERTPIQKLPQSQWKQARHANNFPNNGDHVYQENMKNQVTLPQLTEEQCRVLSTLPDVILYTLLECLEKARIDNMGKEKFKKNIPAAIMCRFCRNNGERESFVRSHTLKDSYGRVCCPVLRSFVCTRCGAQGDYAHTIKYCPLTTTEERNKSMAILKSMRMASGRRRSPFTGRTDEYIFFGELTPSTIQDSVVINSMPLDPKWEALEQKLSMSFT